MRTLSSGEKVEKSRSEQSCVWVVSEKSVVQHDLWHV
jgi:hypothetical protein